MIPFRSLPFQLISLLGRDIKLQETVKQLSLLSLELLNAHNSISTVSEIKELRFMGRNAKSSRV